MKDLIFPYIHTLGATHKDLFSLAKFFTPSEALALFDSPSKELVSGISPDRLSEMRDKATKNPYQKFVTEFEKTGARIVFSGDEEYPKCLWHVSDQPFYISVLGNLPSSDCLAVVGSRKNTPYGSTVVEHFVPAFVRAGFGIVSWGALWIDAKAHEAALKSRWYTLAVIGTGIDRFYPVANKATYRAILESGGGIVSHFPLGEEPRPYNFPIRNELVVAFSRWVLVVEASEKSGTLITARLALELGRDVFAPPADFNRANSIGTNLLLKNGLAKAVISPSDVLEEYVQGVPKQLGLSFVHTAPPKFSDAFQALAYECVAKGKGNPDEIAHETWKPIHEVLPSLSLLELSGYICTDISGNYQIGSWKR